MRWGIVIIILIRKNNYDLMAQHKFEMITNYNNIGNYYGEVLEVNAGADKKSNKTRHGLGI